MAAGLALARNHPAGTFLALLPVVLLASLLIMRGRPLWGNGTPRRSTGFLWAVALIALTFLLGAGFSIIHARNNPVPDLLATWRAHGFEPYHTPVTLRGRLLDLEILPGDRAALWLRFVDYRISGRPGLRGSAGRPVTVRLTTPWPPLEGRAHWRPGERLEITARLGPARSFRNPGAFNYGSYLQGRGIHLTGTIKSSQLVRRIEGEKGGRRFIMPAIRARLVASLRRAAGAENETTAAFLSALLVGERSALPARLEATLRRAGVYHIIALSGLNVGLVALLAATLLRLLPLRIRSRRGLTTLAIVAYGAVVRGSGSIQRAILMGLLLLSGGIAGRPVSALGAIAVSAILLLIRRPVLIEDAGFQLTFGATLGIVLLAPQLPDPSRCSLARLALQPLGVSAAALAGITLITAFHFHTITPAALLGNLAAVPIASLLLYLAILIVAIEPLIPGIARLAASTAEHLLAWLETVCRIVSSPELSSFYVLPPSSTLVICGGIALIAAGVYRGRPARIASAVLSIVFLVVATNGRLEKRHGGNLELIVLDVAQGDALLLRFPTGLTMLIDAGGFSRSRFDVGERVVAPALRALGHLRIDILVVTHAHQDHLGGAATILDQFAPGALWLGRMPDRHAALEKLVALAEARGIPVVHPRAGVRIRTGGALVEVLHPGRMPGSGSRNNDSLVLRILYNRRALLLTGDLEREGEAGIVKMACASARADLLKVGHHGSRTSTTGDFLDCIDPRWAVISVGSTNPWNHPDYAVLERLRGRGVTVYRTDREGALIFSTDGEGPWRGRRLMEEIRSAGRSGDE